jgi:hypothetical protein
LIEFFFHVDNNKQHKDIDKQLGTYSRHEISKLRWDSVSHFKYPDFNRQVGSHSRHRISKSREDSVSHLKYSGLLDGPLNWLKFFVIAKKRRKFEIYNQ